MPPAPSFLSLDEVLAIHAHQIEHYGGAPGVRELALLESAVAMPQSSFGGELLHGSLFEQAAAYVFHVVRNHPFVDGNKRTGLACGLAFLLLNGVRIRATEDELVDLVLGVVAGTVSKSDVAVFLRSRAVRHDAGA